MQFIEIFVKMLLMYLVSYVGTYWLCCSVYYVIDTMVSKNKYIKSFKIQQDKLPIDYVKYRTTILHIARHQLIAIPLIVLSVPCIMFVQNDMIYQIPTFFDAFTKMFMATLIFDFLFYFVHYALHSKYLYKYHKVHHEWTAPVAAAAHYNHFLEFIIIDIIVPMISIIITGANIVTMMMWIGLGTIIVTATHSGYWLLLAQKHDNHHKYYDCDYGFVVTDYIFGTNRKSQNCA